MSPDARVREKGNRRKARVPASLRLRRRKVGLGRATAIAGIDVGEDFLDLAIIARGKLRLSRIALAGLCAPGALASLAARFAEAAPELSRGAIALVDSPRSPLDADSSSAPMKPRTPAPSRRVIDGALRQLFAHLGQGRLSMYPTPGVDYFVRCVRARGCKPHLRALGCELLKRFPGISSVNMEHPTIDSGGRLFTRFMIAGFAAHAALRMRGVRAFESFPDMEFRLWSEGVEIAPKARRREALAVRRRICSKLARLAGISFASTPRTLDEADAAVLALGAAAAMKRGSTVELDNDAEGKFLVDFPTPRAFSTRSLAGHAHAMTSA